MEAQIEDLEPERLEFFLLFLSDLDAILVQQQASGQGPQPIPPTQGIALPQLAAPPGLAAMGQGGGSPPPRQLAAPTTAAM
jgi:hypothetical protein